MPLHLHYNSSLQSFKTIRGFRARYVNSFPGITFSGLVHYNDLMSRVLGDSYFYVPSFSRTSPEVTGFISGGLNSEDIKISFKPNTFRREYSIDHYLYDSYLTNLRIFSSFLTGNSFPIPDYDHENCTRHVSYSGELTTQQVDIPTWFESYDFYGRVFSVHNYHSDVWGGAYVFNISPLQIEPVAWSLGNPAYKFFNILDILDNLKDTLSITEYQGPDTVIHTLSNVEYELTRSGLVISYHQQTIGYTAGGIFDWDGQITVPFVDCSQTQYPFVGSVYYPSYVGTVEYKFHNATAIGMNTGYDEIMASAHEYTYVDHTVNPVFHSYASRPVTDDLVEQKRRTFWTYSQLFDGRFMKPFRQAVDDNMFDIASSSLFSSVAAFKNAEGSMDVNVLQNLAKLPSISSSFPQIKEAVDILSGLVKRDLSKVSLRKILDLATSTTLQANFQWRPYKDLIENYIPKAAATLHSLGDIQKNAIGYGSFRHKFINEFTRKEATLLTRTKIVIDMSPSELLSAVLGVDALGLLPKYSNYWDLIPFSFAANWFTGIGEAIRRAEYSLFLAAVPAYYVHTYTITTPLTEDELDILEASSSNPEGVSMKIYYRDVSLFSPYPRDSRFGFGIPTQLPPLGTLGSLLYQLIF